MVLQAIMQNGNALQYASDELKGNKEVLVALSIIQNLPNPHAHFADYFTAAPRHSLGGPRGNQEERKCTSLHLR